MTATGGRTMSRFRSSSTTTCARTIPRVVCNAVGASRSRGSSGFGPKLWVPSPEDFLQFAIEDLGSDLQ
jgi:hypothetical protein